MNVKRKVDMVAAGLWLIIVWISWMYLKENPIQEFLMAAASVMAGGFGITAFLDGKKKTTYISDRAGTLPTDSELITELVLLSEEDTELHVWDMYGKVALVIGRDVKENHVDVDLSQSTYASMVEIEHAVLNFSAGSWYIEDLGSANGISVQKSRDGRKYKLASDTPCRLEPGDCIFIGLNRLLLR